MSVIETPQSVTMMQLQGVTKLYRQGPREVRALDGIDLTIERGEMVAIMGPSGSGKSTLLHLLGGLDRPTTGKVHFHGQNLGELTDSELTRLRRRKIGLIFQFFNLLPTLTAQENVALPLLLDGMSRKEANRRAVESLDRLAVAHRGGHFPEQMSGGEMQRVAIARSLAARPVSLLCDEPTGNLDSHNAEDVLRILRELASDHLCTIVLVTHDDHAAECGDRTVRLRDGRIDEEM